MTENSPVRAWHIRYWPTHMGLGLLRLLALLPMRRWPAVSATLGAILQRLVPSRQKIVLRNLSLAFPDSERSWRQEICEQSYQALALSLIEASKLWFSDPHWLDDYVAIEGLEHLSACQARGESVLLVSCHYTSIEVAGAALCRAMPFYPVYAEAKNKYFDQFQQRKRLRFAPDVVSRSDMRKAMRVLRSGGVLWLLPDQAVAASHGALPTLFFDHPVMSSSGPARLQKRSGAKMVHFELQRLASGKLQLTVHAPLDLDTEAEPELRAQQLNHLFEQMIRRAPSQYFWHHKRFKSGRPDINPYA